MKEFLTTYCPFIIVFIVTVEFLSTFFMGYDYISKKQRISLLVTFIGVGLCLDAIVIIIGGFLPENVLSILSRIRFVSHGLLTPLNLAICGYALGWQNETKMKIVWIITGLLSAAGVAAGILRVLETKEFGDIIRQVSSDSSPAWTDIVNTVISFGTILPLVITGVIVTIKQKSPSILLAGILMFAFAAVGPATKNMDLSFFFSMIGEMFMLLFYLIYCRRHVRDTSNDLW